MNNTPSSLLPRPLQTLKRLPLEIAHQILDDLPLLKVLQILSHNDQRLNQRVLTHTKYQRLLPSKRDAATIVEYFHLHREICYFRSNALSGKYSPCGDALLLLNISMLPTRITLGDLRRHLVTQIQVTLQLKVTEFSVMTLYASGPSRPLWQTRCEDLRARWEWIKEATINMNKAKARQLNLMANLLSSSPGNRMLKKPLDPSQGLARTSYIHVAQRLRDDAARCLRNSQLGVFHPFHCTPASHLIELVPYDRYLLLLMRGLEKLQPNRDLATRLAGTQLDQTEGGALPKDIAAEIRVVERGLWFVYTGLPWLIVPRIEWVPATPDRGRKAVFCTRVIKHGLEECENVYRSPGGKNRPHDDREYEWLQAFLKVVSWIEDNLGISVD